MEQINKAKQSIIWVLHCLFNNSMWWTKKRGGFEMSARGIETRQVTPASSAGRQLFIPLVTNTEEKMQSAMPSL